MRVEPPGPRVPVGPEARRIASLVRLRGGDADAASEPSVPADPLELLRLAATVGAVLVAATSTGDVVLLGVLLGVAAGGVAAGAAAVLLLSQRRLGGVTGDVLGAAGLVGETVGLVIASARW